MKESSSAKPVVFTIFFISGFCGLLYEIVWTRLAVASFGAVTPVLSVVVSAFMLGLALGSWAGGRWVQRAVVRWQASPIVLYAVLECLIGTGAIAIPFLFAAENKLLLKFGATDSGAYLVMSVLAIGVAIVPWTTFMGATFPVMMAFIRERYDFEERSFSFLYLANSFGGAVGVLATAYYLIEINGFRQTLLVAAQANVLAALFSLWLARKTGWRAVKQAQILPEPVAQLQWHWNWNLTVLFFTGFASMALEVVWTRIIVGPVNNTVYGFALILAAYLIATTLGSAAHRSRIGWLAKVRTGEMMLVLGSVASLPLLLGDQRFGVGILGLTLAVFPFCAILGCLTPKLVEEFSQGDPRKAGLAYGLNIAGCIVGPLVASYLLLPVLGEKFSSLTIAVLFPVLALGSGLLRSQIRLAALSPALGLALIAVVATLFAQPLVEGPNVPEKIIRRDHTGTVVSYGTGMNRRLMVNGIGMTVLTPVTKSMVHLPLVFRPKAPESALIICFGMGTSYRAALSWGMRTTGVELVPSVVGAFGFYHADVQRVLADPNGQIFVDDGRRFLNRTRNRYDLIVIDPPPPIQAAGSGILYATEMYRAVNDHLTPTGVLQQWYPEGGPQLFQAVLHSVRSVFPYVRIFGGLQGWGIHVLASQAPLEKPSVETALARMPARARADLVEWTSQEPAAVLSNILSREVDPSSLVIDSDIPEITDDHPYNEYDWLRRGSRVQ